MGGSANGISNNPNFKPGMMPGRQNMPRMAQPRGNAYGFNGMRPPQAQGNPEMWGGGYRRDGVAAPGGQPMPGVNSGTTMPQAGQNNPPMWGGGFYRGAAPDGTMPSLGGSGVSMQPVNPPTTTMPPNGQWQDTGFSGNLPPMQPQPFNGNFSFPPSLLGSLTPMRGY